MLEIKIESNNLSADWTCCVCQKEFGLDVITAILYVDGERVEDVCPDCLEGGPEVIKKHFLERAAKLREKTKTIVQELLLEAQELEKLAANDISCPTQEEWDMSKLNIPKLDAVSGQEEQEWQDSPW
jgi:hypothetical protein